MIVCRSIVWPIALPIYMLRIYLIGLSSIGPIAHGWFAANMGQGLIKGWPMAMLRLQR